MRRPLTTNGIPFVQSGGVAPGDVLFDVNDLDPAYSYAVTLYCWAPVVGGEIAAIVAAGILTGGDPLIPSAILEVPTNFVNYQLNGNGPAKVLDRIPMRGDQQLVVAKQIDNSSVYWFGYFERVGVAPTPLSYRPLQPGALVSPYNAPTPSLVVGPAGGTVATDVHQLDTERFDYLWLDITSTLDVPAGASPEVNLLLPGGVSLPFLLSDTFASGAGSPIRIFDGIPFRAPSSADALLQLQVVADDTAITIAIASGRFARA